VFHDFRGISEDGIVSRGIETLWSDDQQLWRLLSEIWLESDRILPLELYRSLQGLTNAGSNSPLNCFYVDSDHSTNLYPNRTKLLHFYRDNVSGKSSYAWNPFSPLFRQFHQHTTSNISYHAVAINAPGKPPSPTIRQIPYHPHCHQTHPRPQNPTLHLIRPPLPHQHPLHGKTTTQDILTHPKNDYFYGAGGMWCRVGWRFWLAWKF